jgi:predicted metal-dependent hydrolase
MTLCAKQAFKQRVRHWARQLDVPIAWLAVRPMRQKWASCSTSGHLHFSTDLLSLDPTLWDYVIVHELLHFSVPNHGRLWKALMRAHLGDWEAAEQRLQRVAALQSISPANAPAASPDQRHPARFPACAAAVDPE